MLNKIIETLKTHPISKGNSIFEKEAIEEATKTFNAGWDALKDGVVIQTSGNMVAVKSGSKIVKYEMKDFRVESGKLIGNINKTIGEIDVPEEKKEAFLAKAIITRFWTIKTI